MKIHSTAVLRRAKKIYWSDQTRKDLFTCMAVGSILGLILGMSISITFFYFFID